MDINKFEIKFNIDFCGKLKVQLLYDGKIVSEDSVYISDIESEMNRGDYD